MLVTDGLCGTDTCWCLANACMIVPVGEFPARICTTKSICNQHPFLMQLLSAPLNDQDNKVASFIWSTWAKFAADKGQLFWPKYDQNHQYYLDITLQPQVMTGGKLFHQPSMAFWDNLRQKRQDRHATRTSKPKSSSL